MAWSGIHFEEESCLMKIMSLFFTVFLILCAPATSFAQEQYETPKTMPFQPIPKELLGTWTLGPYFDYGIGHDFNIDPESILGEKITITKQGFEFVGYRCEADGISWRGETGGGDFSDMKGLPLEDRFKYKAVHSIYIDCNLEAAPLPDAVLPFFWGGFIIYYDDDTIVMTYTPQYGPQFILKPNIEKS